MKKSLRVSIVGFICFAFIISLQYFVATYHLTFSFGYVILCAIACFFPLLTFIIERPWLGRHFSFKAPSAEFEDAYQKLRVIHFTNLEDYREPAAFEYFYTRMIGFWIAFGMPLILSIFSLLTPLIIAIMLLCVAIGAFLLCKDVKAYTEYKKIFKDTAARNFVSLISDKLTYKGSELGDYDIESDYALANFDNKIYSRFSFRDFVEGVLNDSTSVKIADVHTSKNIGSDYFDVFEGIFLSAKSYKNINAYVKVCRNKAIVLKDANLRVTSGDATFDKYFAIYSDDKELATKLLPENIMQRLIDFRVSHNVDIEFVLRNGDFYLRFYTGDVFNAKLFGTSMSKTLLLTYFDIFKFATDLSADMDIIIKKIDLKS